MNFFVFFVVCFINVHEGKLYTTVVTFGDSLSDTGNGYRISNHTWPIVPPFNSNGGYADDLLWNEILTEQYLSNAILQDYSYDSATTDSQLVQGTMNSNPNLVTNYLIRNNTKPPSVRQQIQEYINATVNQTIDFDRTLYIIWIGMNNYRFNNSITPVQTVESIIDCANRLILFGGRNLILINQPPFDRFPHFRNQTNTTKYLYIQHNQLLTEQINQTYFSLSTRLNVKLFDSYTFISTVLDNYISYGFENLDNCWDTESSSVILIKCDNITARIFADESHLTSAMQRLIAQQLYFTLSSSNVISVNLVLFFVTISIIVFFQINILSV